MDSAERLLQHIERVVGAPISHFSRLNVPEARGSVNCCVFDDRPKMDARTLVTIGLSHSHPDAGTEHVEFILEVSSNHDIWLIAISELAGQVKRMSFRPGELFTVGEPFLPTESGLSCFAIVDPLSLAKADCSIDLGSRVVHFRQLIPLFTREYEYALRVGGLVAMSEFQRNPRFVPSNVKRPDLSDLLP